MDQDRKDKPAQDEGTERAEEGRKNRAEMDEPPPPGADPLHEGP